MKQKLISTIVIFTFALNSNGAEHLPYAICNKPVATCQLRPMASAVSVPLTPELQVFQRWADFVAFSALTQATKIERDISNKPELKKFLEDTRVSIPMDTGVIRGVGVAIPSVAIPNNLSAIKPMLSIALTAEQESVLFNALGEARNVIYGAEDKLGDSLARPAFAELKKDFHLMAQAIVSYIHIHGLLRNSAHFISNDFEKDVEDFINEPKNDFQDRISVAMAELLVRNRVIGAVRLLSREEQEKMPAAVRTNIIRALTATIASCPMIRSDGRAAISLDLCRSILSDDYLKDADSYNSLLYMMLADKAVDLRDVDTRMRQDTMRRLLDKLIPVRKLSTATAQKLSVAQFCANMLIMLDRDIAFDLLRSKEYSYMAYPMALVLEPRAKEKRISAEEAEGVREKLRLLSEESRWPVLTQTEVEAERQNEGHCGFIQQISQKLMFDDSTWKVINETIAKAYHVTDEPGLNALAMRNIGRTVNALRAVPRQIFLPKFTGPWAFADMPLAIFEGQGQTISMPSLVAEMSAMLNLQGGERVLEIGTGSGWQAAILSQLVGEKGRVFTIEVHESLKERAKAACDSLKIQNIDFLVQDGGKGLAEKSPFDAIIVTCGAPSIPKPLLDQLSPEEGRLLIPIMSSAAQAGIPEYTLTLIVRQKDNYSYIPIMPTHWVPMVGEHGHKAPAASPSAAKVTSADTGTDSKSGTYMRADYVVRAIRSWVNMTKNLCDPYYRDLARPLLDKYAEISEIFVRTKFLSRYEREAYLEIIIRRAIDLIDEYLSKGSGDIAEIEKDVQAKTLLIKDIELKRRYEKALIEGYGKKPHYLNHLQEKFVSLARYTVELRLCGYDETAVRFVEEAVENSIRAVASCLRGFISSTASWQYQEEIAEDFLEALIDKVDSFESKKEKTKEACERSLREFHPTNAQTALSDILSDIKQAEAEKREAARKAEERRMDEALARERDRASSTRSHFSYSGGGDLPSGRMVITHSMIMEQALTQICEAILQTDNRILEYVEKFRRVPKTVLEEIEKELSERLDDELDDYCDAAEAKGEVKKSLQEMSARLKESIMQDTRRRALMQLTQPPSVENIRTQRMADIAKYHIRISDAGNLYFAKKDNSRVLTYDIFYLLKHFSLVPLIEAISAPASLNQDTIIATMNEDIEAFIRSAEELIRWLDEGWQRKQGQGAVSITGISYPHKDITEFRQAIAELKAKAGQILSSKSALAERLSDYRKLYTAVVHQVEAVRRCLTPDTCWADWENWPLILLEKELKQARTGPDGATWLGPAINEIPENEFVRIQFVSFQKSSACPKSARMISVGGDFYSWMRDEAIHFYANTMRVQLRGDVMDRMIKETSDASIFAFRLGKNIKIIVLNQKQRGRTDIRDQMCRIFAKCEVKKDDIIFNEPQEQEKKDTVPQLKKQVRQESEDPLVRFAAMVEELLGAGEIPLIVSDLDKTVKEANAQIPPESRIAIINILRAGAHFAALTSTDFERTKKDFINPLIADIPEAERGILKNLIIAINNGSQIYKVNELTGELECIFCIDMKQELGPEKFPKLREAIMKCMDDKKLDIRGMLDRAMGWKFNDAEWDRFKESCYDERPVEGAPGKISQVSYMMLGKDVDKESKNLFSQRGSKQIREVVAKYLGELLRSEGIALNIAVSGQSSIDLSLPGIDKGFGFAAISAVCGRSISHMIFFADAFSKGSNDEPALKVARKVVNVGPRIDIILSPYYNPDLEFIQMPDSGYMGFIEFANRFVELVSRHSQPTNKPAASPSAAKVTPAEEAQADDAGKTKTENVLLELDRLSRQKPPLLAALEAFHRAHTDREVIFEADQKVFDEIEEASSGLVDAAKGAFQDLKGARTLETVSAAFNGRKAYIFTAMEKLRLACIKLAMLRKEYEYYYMFTRIDNPAYGICEYARDCLVEAAKQSGLSAGEGDDKVVFPETVVYKDSLHAYIGIKGERYKIAVDICSGAAIEENLNAIAVSEFDGYRRDVIRGIEKFQSRGLPRNRAELIEYFRSIDSKSSDSVPAVSPSAAKISEASSEIANLHSAQQVLVDALVAEAERINGGALTDIEVDIADFAQTNPDHFIYILIDHAAKSDQVQNLFLDICKANIEAANLLLNHALLNLQYYGNNWRMYRKISFCLARINNKSLHYFRRVRSAVYLSPNDLYIDNEPSESNVNHVYTIMRRARKGYVDRLRPIMVVKSDLPGGGYRVIDGKKKVRASQRLGLRYIPALLKVRGISFEAPAVKTGLNAEFGKDRAALAALASAA